jgi:hypothetical protein
VNWTLFAIVLGQIDPTTQRRPPDWRESIGLMPAFFVVVMLAGRFLGPPTLHRLRASLPGRRDVHRAWSP